jgi:hypothetical protein
LYIITGQFKTVARLVSERGGDIVSRFHPKKLLIAYGQFLAENWSIPFSDFFLQTDEHLKKITKMEWNVISSFLRD